VKLVLIVDDSPVVRRFLSAALSDAGWIVCGEAENGRDGIIKAQLLHPDLIILDLSMPEMNGLQAARELKRLMPAVRLLMFTACSNPYLSKVALAAGVHAVVDKADTAALMGSIQKLLPSASAA
jgi:two-component system chemotaxis response regulator CheY